MQSSDLPNDEREEGNPVDEAPEIRPPGDIEPMAALDDASELPGESTAQAVGFGDPSDLEHADTPAASSSAADSPVDVAASSRDVIHDETLDSSSPDEAVSRAPDPGFQVDDGSDQPSAGEQSSFESVPSIDDISGYTHASSTADSFVPDDGLALGTDFADVAGDGSESRTVTESVADPWLNSMMATHSRGSSFYSPPDDLAGGDDASAPDSTEEAPPTSKPFIGPLLGSDGEDPAEQWMRYYQAVHDAARNPRIYTNDRPIPSEDSLALPLALPVTLRHMTPLVEKLIGRAAIEIHQVCEELAKQQIDQFKYELYTEMRALG